MYKIPKGTVVDYTDPHSLTIERTTDFDWYVESVNILVAKTENMLANIHTINSNIAEYNILFRDKKNNSHGMMRINAEDLHKIDEYNKIEHVL